MQGSSNRIVAETEITHLAEGKQVCFTKLMTPLSFDANTLSSTMVVLLAGGGVQSIVTLQFLLTGIGVRSIFLGFCAVLLGVWIGTVRLEPTLKNSITLNEMFFPTLSSASGQPLSKESVENLLQSRVDPRVDELLKAKLASSTASLPIRVLLSDLTRALYAGILLLIPFIIIDLVVQHVFRLLEFNGISTAVVALPLKVLLFLSVDGWSLLTERLIS